MAFYEDLISRKIKQARKEANFSQGDLAKEIGFGQRAISGWEQNETQPSYDTLASIAKATGKPLTWFFEELDEEYVIEKRIDHTAIDQKSNFELFGKLVNICEEIKVEQNKMMDLLEKIAKNL